MTPAQLSRTIRHLLCRGLPDSSGDLSATRVVVESPPRRGEGDYATGIAFRVAAASGRAPGEVAASLCARLLAEADGIADARVVGGGFINVTLTPRARAGLVRSLTADRPAGMPDPAAEPGPEPGDVPARDIPRWAALTGESPRDLAVRSERAGSLFRVQYAHARACALLRNGRRLGIGPAAECAEPLAPAGARLLALLADRARITSPGPLARHLDAVAGAFAAFRESCEPLPRGEEKPGAAHRGRLALAEATQAVLAGGLSQLGVTAPAHL
ncbi:DALR anticodon-binding domain-containing protein [Streptomyces albus subsp. chlorinus]|uniref:DALR anticodon-binding domain-containing protein n=1 Tax=Streptomyces albus TaxID=1888 RepID=UPI0031F61F64